MRLQHLGLQCTAAPPEIFTKCRNCKEAAILTICPCCARYAQRSKEARLEWSAFTKEYFLKRETLANVLLLVDSSVPVQVPYHTRLFRHAFRYCNNSSSACAI